MDVSRIAVNTDTDNILYAPDFSIKQAETSKNKMPEIGFNDYIDSSYALINKGARSKPHHLKTNSQKPARFGRVMALNQTATGTQKAQYEFPLSDLEQDVPNTQGAGLPSTESDDFIIFDKAKNQGAN